MKRMLKYFCLSWALLTLALSANAADTIMYLPIEPAIKQAKEQGIIDGSVTFKFGSNSGSRDKIFAKDLVTNKKARKLGNSAEDSCVRAFHSALIQFQQRAKQDGATKVVNLIGYFKKKPYDSKKDFQCGVGGLMSGVALKGDLAK